VFRKKRAIESHPDPAIALKLQHIQSLMAVKSSIQRQLNVYLEEIQVAHERLDDACARHSEHRPGDFGYISASQLNLTSAICKDRITAAKHGINSCREELLDTQQKIEAYITETGLNDFDLAYLNLGKR
jgi:hypothetical protein